MPPGAESNRTLLSLAAPKKIYFLGTGTIRPRTLRPRMFCPRTIRPCALHPDSFTSPHVSSLRRRVRFIPEKTHCHEKCVCFVPELIDFANFWSLFFPKNILANFHYPWVSGPFALTKPNATSYPKELH
jgi:hypothetical protein